MTQANDVENIKTFLNTFELILDRLENAGNIRSLNLSNINISGKNEEWLEMVDSDWLSGLSWASKSEFEKWRTISDAKKLHLFLILYILDGYIRLYILDGQT